MRGDEFTLEDGGFIKSGQYYSIGTRAGDSCMIEGLHDSLAASHHLLIRLNEASAQNGLQGNRYNNNEAIY
jgi:hypothetical protein